MTPEEAAALIDIPEIERVSRVSNLGPDDVIVCEAPSSVILEIGERIRKHLQRYWPNHGIVVLVNGLRLKVMPSSEVPK